MKQMVIDMCEGETFMVTGEAIKKAIRSRCHDELRGEMQSYMREVASEIEESTDAEGHATKRSQEERAGLFLAVMRSTNASPPVLLLRSCLAKSAAAQDEIDELMYIFHNIQEDPGVLYKLNLKQLKRYGMMPKTGEQ